MPTLVVLAVLLAVECGHQYKIRRDPGLSVFKYEQATAAQDGIRYRIAADGVNYCCSVQVEILNVGADAVNVTPDAAELTAETCPVKFLSLAFIQGGGTRDFSEMEKQIAARGMASHEPDNPLWQDVRYPGQQFVIAPGSFLTLSYFARGYFRKECGAYSFKLRVGSVNVAATFTEPK